MFFLEVMAGRNGGYLCRQKCYIFYKVLLLLLLLLLLLIKSLQMAVRVPIIGRRLLIPGFY